MAQLSLESLSLSSSPPLSRVSGEEKNWSRGEKEFRKCGVKIQEKLVQAACLIRQCDFLLIGAGAGMGIPSGLGTFRGAGAFHWPPFERKDVNYIIACNPARLYMTDRLGGPSFGWSFWKNCIESYTSTSPHEGYHILAKWTKVLDQKYTLNKKYEKLTKPCCTLPPPVSPVFVYTSNIDGHFLRIPTFCGRVVECHGSALFLQCQRTKNCTAYKKTWRIDPKKDLDGLEVDPQTHLVNGTFPQCIGSCCMVSRPQVYMFGDGTWLEDETDQQENVHKEWCSAVMRVVLGDYDGVDEKEKGEEEGKGNQQEEKKRLEDKNKIEEEEEKKEEEGKEKEKEKEKEEGEEEEEKNEKSGGEKIGKRIVAIEIGAGKTIPSVRYKAESFCGEREGVLIRINPFDSDPPSPPSIHSISLFGEEKLPQCISIPLGALEALNALDWLIGWPDDDVDLEITKKISPC